MANLFRASSEAETRKFYEDLNTGKERRGLWGKENRFEPRAIIEKESVRTHFAHRIAPYLGPSDQCLDVGCGPGGFLAIAARMCGRIVGLDIVPSFVENCREVIADLQLGNASAILGDSAALPFADAEFDRVIMVDTIHHLASPPAALQEIHRVLRPGGLLLVFEPNKLNPLLAAMCALDRNEHGLLRMGTFRSYRKLLGDNFRIEHESYNGLLIGPSSSGALAVADALSRPPLVRTLGWLSPKLFIAARKL